MQHDSHKRVEILREIEGLARDGVIRIGRGMKWRSLTRQPASEPIGKPQGGPLVARVSNALLQAIPAKFEVRALPGVEQEDVATIVDRPDPNALLRYYRSALRSDPRGALTQTDDRHGISFQLVTGNGDWLSRTATNPSSASNLTTCRANSERRFFGARQMRTHLLLAGRLQLVANLARLQSGQWGCSPQLGNVTQLRRSCALDQTISL